MTDSIGLIQEMMAALNRMTLTGVKDWELGMKIASGLVALKHGLEEEREAKKRAEDEELERKREERKRQLEEAAARGEEILGGETIRLNADGTTEVLIP